MYLTISVSIEYDKKIPFDAFIIMACTMYSDLVVCKIMVTKSLDAEALERYCPAYKIHIGLPSFLISAFIRLDRIFRDDLFQQLLH